MAIIEFLIKYSKPIMEFGKSILALFKLKSENTTLKSENDVLKNKVESLEEQLKKSDAARRKFEDELSMKKHAELLKEQKLVTKLNAENEEFWRNY